MTFKNLIAAFVLYFVLVLSNLVLMIWLVCGGMIKTELAAKIIMWSAIPLIFGGFCVIVFVLRLLFQEWKELE